MKHDVICAWLGLNPEHWPPDHYTLLGLEPRETDVARIEHSVHQLMARLRCYQICNPEQATEAMNRLAQAFMCLTDAVAKKNYDAGLLSPAGSLINKTPSGSLTRTAAPLPTTPVRQKVTEPAPASRRVSMPAALLDTAVGIGPATQVDWKNTLSPPPVRTLVSQASEELGTRVSEDVNRVPPEPVAATSPVDAKPGPADAVTPPRAAEVRADASASGPLAKYKGFSPALLRRLTCRRGLGTKRELYRRIRKTRRLLNAWERAGKYLRKPKRKLMTPADETELGRALAAIGQNLRGFPCFLGQPGQPGYRIAARARLAYAVDWLNALSDEERELLAQDWTAGQTLLASYRQFLRKEARAVCRLNGWGLSLRVLVNDLPVQLALLAALVGLTILVLALR